MELQLPWFSSLDTWLMLIQPTMSTIPFRGALFSVDTQRWRDGKDSMNKKELYPPF